jgi:hypothetical protein
MLTLLDLVVDFIKYPVEHIVITGVLIVIGYAFKQWAQSRGWIQADNGGTQDDGHDRHDR